MADRRDFSFSPPRRTGDPQVDRAFRNAYDMLNRVWEAGGGRAYVEQQAAAKRFGQPRTTGDRTLDYNFQEAFDTLNKLHPCPDELPPNDRRLGKKYDPREYTFSMPRSGRLPVAAQRNFRDLFVALNRFLPCAPEEVAVRAAIAYPRYNYVFYCGRSSVAGDIVARVRLSDSTRTNLATYSEAGSPSHLYPDQGEQKVWIGHAFNSTLYSVTMDGATFTTEGSISPYEFIQYGMDGDDADDLLFCAARNSSNICVVLKVDLTDLGTEVVYTGSDTSGYGSAAAPWIFDVQTEPILKRVYIAEQVHDVGTDEVKIGYCDYEGTEYTEIATFGTDSVTYFSGIAIDWVNREIIIRKRSASGTGFTYYTTDYEGNNQTTVNSDSAPDNEMSIDADPSGGYAYEAQETSGGDKIERTALPFTTLPTGWHTTGLTSMNAVRMGWYNE